MKLSKTLAMAALSTLLATGVALAGGAPNDTAGAQGRNAPSSVTATPGMAGRSAAMVTGRSASMRERMMMKRHMMMKHRMMKHRMMKRRMMRNGM